MTASDLNAALVKQELTLFGFSILGQCRECEKLVSQLAKAAGVSSQAASQAVDRLQERGLVARARLENDNRRVSVSTTDKGKEMLAQIEGGEA